MSIFINYKVVSDQGQFLGVTGVGLSVSAVTGLIESYKARYGREIYFLDRKGNITLDRGDGVEARMLQDMSGISALSAQILTTPSASLTY
jgi:hypothetical protein